MNIKLHERTPTERKAYADGFVCALRFFEMAIDQHRFWHGSFHTKAKARLHTLLGSWHALDHDARRDIAKAEQLSPREADANG